MDNTALIRVAKRLTALIHCPLFLLAFTIMLFTSVFTWIVTGKDLEDQFDFLEEKNADYWKWVKA